MSGLKTATATHMLRRVLGKTPSFCSSTKFAELSNPLMPSSAAEKPKKRAAAMPPGAGARQFATNSDGSPATATADATTSAASVVIWATKMASATLADSVMPTRFRSAKRPSRATVAQKASSPGTRLWA
jgi:hypothetical protein